MATGVENERVVAVLEADGAGSHDVRLAKCGLGMVCGRCVRSICGRVLNCSCAYSGEETATQFTGVCWMQEMSDESGIITHFWRGGKK